jgi:hypothetical protein
VIFICIVAYFISRYKRLFMRAACKKFVARAIADDV